MKLIIDKIKLKYSISLIEPGTAVGIIAAQSFSEPLTQYMLDAHHRSAAGGTSNTGMKKVKEVLGAKDVPKLSSPSMLLPIISEFSGNKAKVQEIANDIEMIKFKQFIVLWQIFFEKYGQPVHPDYVHEAEFIKEFGERNPLLKPPGDLVKWCIRFVINKTNLILKNMSLELIITKLRELFPDLYFVYTPENSKKIIIRVYMRNTIFKSEINTNVVKDVKESLINTTIRGINGITNTTVIKMVRNKINEDGSISRNNNLWGITTQGTNLPGIMSNKYIDCYNLQTDAIQETYRIFGIEAARQKIISEIRNLVDICNHRHYLVYADEMTFTGKVTSIESSGLKSREASNILLRAGFSAPISTLEDAAINSLEDNITGITSSLIVGSVPKIGTLYNSLQINEKFIQENVKRPDDYIEELM